MPRVTPDTPALTAVKREFADLTIRDAMLLVPAREFTP